MNGIIICVAIYFFVGHIYLSYYYWEYGYGSWWECDSKERIATCIHHIIWPVKLFFKQGIS